MQTDKKVLRTFGFVMVGAFAVVAALVLWRSDWMYTPWVEGFSITSALFLALALVAPRLLAPLEWAWMKLAMVLNFVMTRVLLMLVFFLAVTPIGLIFKLLRKDLLGKRFDPKADTYWVPPDEDGPWTRADKPY
jgi:hypothetical protein